MYQVPNGIPRRIIKPVVLAFAFRTLKQLTKRFHDLCTLLYAACKIGQRCGSGNLTHFKLKTISDQIYQKYGISTVPTNNGVEITHPAPEEIGRGIEACLSVARMELTAAKAGLARQICNDSYTSRENDHQIDHLLTTQSKVNTALMALSVDSEEKNG